MAALKKLSIKDMNREKVKRKDIVYRLRFVRKGNLRYLSHLDQIKLIRRIIRRTGLPVIYSEGFHPQMRVSFGPAISVGYESEAEYVDIELSREFDYKEVIESIISQSPEQFLPIEIKKIPSFLPSLEASVNLGKYSIYIPEDISSGGSINEKISKFLSTGEVLVEKIKKDKKEIINIRPLVREIKYDGSNCIELTLEFGPKKNVKVEKIVAVVLGLDDKQMKLLLVTRKELGSTNGATTGVRSARLGE
jgi:radical SAM-linked protein